MQQSPSTKILQNEAPTISILWDAAPLWGHLVLNAVIQTGLSYTLIRAKDCFKKGIQSKILIVPGGSGRLKSSKLGAEGINAIRKFVENGGTYIGFCGGAGLALTDKNEGLALCPWGRSFYKDRIQHLVSGHIISSLNQDELIPSLINDAPCTEAPLPVWWPGKFQEPESNIMHHKLQGPVRVLARYKDMGNDLHVADLPIQKLPASALDDCYNLYGITLRPSLLDGQPAIITGSFGRGKYILSYTHLETPDSPFANAIFAHMLRTCLEEPTTSQTTQSNSSAHHTTAETTENLTIKPVIDAATPTQKSTENLSTSISTFEAHGNGLAQNILNTKEYKPTWQQHIQELMQDTTTQALTQDTTTQAITQTPVQTIMQTPIHTIVQTPTQDPASLATQMPTQAPQQIVSQSWIMLNELHSQLEELFKLGVDLHLLFPRTDWLYGWHSSVPGSHLNALRVALLCSLLLPVNEKRQQYITTHGLAFSENMHIFIGGAKSWLLARRLSETMAEADTIPRPILQAQRQELFGMHMAGGGLCGSLIDWLDEFLFLN